MYIVIILSCEMVLHDDDDYYYFHYFIYQNINFVVHLHTLTQAHTHLNGTTSFDFPFHKSQHILLLFVLCYAMLNP